MARLALRRASAALAAALLAPACAHLPRGSALAECPGELTPTAEIEGEFLRRERVRVEGLERELDARFALAVQKRGDELVVIGLDPLGVRLFTATQRGEALELEALPARMQPVPPRNLLRDLHRARFGAPAGSGVDVERAGPRVSIRNPACRYRAEFELVSEQALP